jgi:simple sugar transport system ATP-binding protein
MNLEMQTQPVSSFIAMHNIWKSFPGVKANKGIDLEFRAGEVHALLGENGAGKTTLMNILAGIYKADKGEIRINDRHVEIRSPVQAIGQGIGMVHQHFRLVDNMTVAENIHLGWKETPWHVSHRSLAQRTDEITSRLGFSIDTKSKIWQLSVGEQQRVEILRALARGAQLLILDEPTAVLTPSEAMELFIAIRSMTKQGRTVVFISHKLDEVLEISDQVTVLRAGSKVETLPTSECTHHNLARLMVGRDVIFQSIKKTGESMSPILEMEGINAVNDRSLPALIGINLSIMEGEILGIAGVSGNGQGELAEVLTGLRPVQGGRFVIDGKEMTGKSPRDLAKAGVGHIPEDRLARGLAASLSVTHNAILRRYRESPIRQGVRMVENAARQFADHIIKQADVRLSNPQVKAQTLSGGNQQKLIARREMDIASRVLVAVHPTRGLDVAATDEVRRSLVDHRNKGNAVLLISADLDEILMLSDRIGVMYEGRIVGILNDAEADREKIGLMMGGGENERKRSS